MIKVAIVGTGGMAHAHIREYNQIRGCKVVAAVDVREDALHGFADEYKIPHRFTDVKALIKHCQFDAASVVTPDAFHVPCALPLVRAGKHVLCEKPIAPTAADARPLVNAAEKAGVINMINFSYRMAPVLHHARTLVEKGALGRLLHMEAHYLQTWLSSPIWGEWSTSPAWLWRCSSAHGSSGVLGDVGVHIVDLCTYVCAERVKKVNAELKTFDKAPGGRIGDYVLDANDSALLRVELEQGGIGTINATRWATGQLNTLALSLHGDKGALKINLDTSYDELDVCLGNDRLTATWKTVKCKPTPNIYQRFIKSIRTGTQDRACFRAGLEVQKVLDAANTSDAERKTVTIRYASSNQRT